MRAGATAAGRSEGADGTLQRVGAPSTGEVLSGAYRISFASLTGKGSKKSNYWHYGTPTSSEEINMRHNRLGTFRVPASSKALKIRVSPERPITLLRWFDTTLLLVRGMESA